MSDWQVGDKAVCVDAKPRPYTAMSAKRQLVEGATYCVVGVRIAPCGTALNLFLRGCEYPHGLGHRADRFRRIRPDKHEDCEPEFVELLKRSKRSAPVEHIIGIDGDD